MSVNYQQGLDVLDDDIRCLKETFKRLRRCVNAKTANGDFVSFPPEGERELDTNLGCINVAVCNLFDTMTKMETWVSLQKL